MTNQLQPVSLGVLFEVFSEPEMTGGVEDEREGVVWCEGDSDKRDDVWVRELTAC